MKTSNDGSTFLSTYWKIRSLETLTNSYVPGIKSDNISNDQIKSVVVLNTSAIDIALYYFMIGSSIPEVPMKSADGTRNINTHGPIDYKGAITNDRSILKRYYGYPTIKNTCF